VNALTRPGYCCKLSTVNMVRSPLYSHTWRVYHVHALILHRL